MYCCLPGGYSIYGPGFDYEDSDLHHNQVFLLTTAPGLEDVHSSQFIITTSPLPQLDNQNIIFGQVIRGFGVVKQVGVGEEVGGGRSGRHLEMEIEAITFCLLMALLGSLGAGEVLASEAGGKGVREWEDYWVMYFGSERA